MGNIYLGEPTPEGFMLCCYVTLEYLSGPQFPWLDNGTLGRDLYVPLWYWKVINSFNKEVLSTYCEPSVVQGTKDPEMTTTDLVPSLTQLTDWDWERWSFIQKVIMLSCNCMKKWRGRWMGKLV